MRSKQKFIPKGCLQQASRALDSKSRDVWVAQLVRCLRAQGSGLDLRGVRWSLMMRLSSALSSMLSLEFV